MVSFAVAAESLSGFIYLDVNNNNQKDPSEIGLSDILISNGIDVSKSDRNGKWILPITADSLVFIIKPSEYAVALNNALIPQHYLYLNKDSLQKSDEINFPLYESDESDQFSVLLFGDPQARGIREVNFISHDVVEECIGTDASFGITLGDIVADDPNLFAEISQSISQIGIPWYNVFGNHDNDRNVANIKDKDKTFNACFGPSTYAYEYGQVAFIVLNNIFFKPDGGYRPGFTENQIKFVHNYLEHVPKDRLIVLMMHAPIVACKGKEKIFSLLEERPHTLSVSSHLHDQVHIFVDDKFGWKGSKPHHHFVNATVSGSWWCGMIDELGIPHATMNDGAPNGYSIITFNGVTYSIVFKAARRPADYQMNIYLADDIPLSGLDTTKVLVNVFAGSERSNVNMRFDEKSKWLKLEQVVAIDPQCLRMHQLSPILDQKVNGVILEEVFGWKMDYPHKSRHMWEGSLPGDLNKGTHKITVRTNDMFGQTYTSHRIFRIR
jgi:hypothetical protein